MRERHDHAKLLMPAGPLEWYCVVGFRAVDRRVPRLLEELSLAHADGTYTPLLGRLAKIDVLVLDDWGLAPVKDQERRDLLEVFKDRHGLRSTVITSQIPVGKWHDHLGDPTIVDAVLDRIVHNAHRVALKAPRAARARRPRRAQRPEPQTPDGPASLRSEGDHDARSR
jgi:DNA replication protein DnaC